MSELVVIDESVPSDEITEFLKLPPEERAASIIADLLSENGLGCDLPIKHTICDGMYMRAMFIPKGSAVVGRVHKQECINICNQGKLAFLGLDGSITNVESGFTGISMPGSLKIVYALEDSTWINVFRTDKTDIEAIENQLVFSPEETMKLIDPKFKYIKKEMLLCHLAQ